MNATRESRQNIYRLFKIRYRFDRASSREKLQLLQTLSGVKVRTSAELKHLHTALCFIRAFPDTIAHFRAAHSLLSRFEETVAKLPAAARSELSDSGIAGTPVYYAFSYEVALWMAQRSPGAISIDWDDMDDMSRLDQLLELLLLPVEADYFDSGLVSSEEWIDLATGNGGSTNFDWLLAQLQQDRFKPIWAQLYNAAELSLIWDLRGTAFSKSLNIVAVRTIKARRNGMRKQVRAVRKEIMRPLESQRKLSARAGSKLIDVAMASLAVRHRETYHFNYANPKEVYLADVGDGISIAVLGLRQQFRYPLECTMGYLILSNGVPIGYGGASALFRQVNTGINIFDEYRGSEASFLWVQVMRTYHHLVGCTRFIANPYQFGSENTEALQSGAFWFYYRLGYRPVLPAIHKLAQRETMRVRGNKSYRSDLRTLRRLACCDMHLTLPGARASDLFEERWIETGSMLATKELAAAGGSTCAESAGRIARSVARDLGIRSVGRWLPSEQRGFSQLAPIVAAAEPAAWPADAKRAMANLLRAKGGSCEAEYARLLSEQEHFLLALRARCRLAE